MFDLREIMGKEMLEQKQLKKLYDRKLQTLPEGSLSVTQKKGRNYYCKYQDGVKSYIGKDCEEITELQTRKLLSEILKRIDANEAIMKNFLAAYQDISLNVVEESLSKAYQSESGEVAVVLGVNNYKNWGTQKYQRSTKYPENLVHRTLKGDMVRSKSEVIIANNLFTKGLQYRSEEITKIGKYIFAPDFKILVPSQNKVKILEHFGMMHDPEYREKALWKISTYIEDGYRPYEDILFTFDDLDGNIDAHNLDILITNFCM